MTKQKYIENIQKSDLDFVAVDRTNRIFICAGGDKNDVSSEMETFIDYIAGKDTGNDLVDKIERKVKDAIARRLWRKEYMDLKEMMNLEFHEGRSSHIVEQVCKKLRKGKDAAVIADELEESESTIEKICNVASKFAPDYDEAEVYREYSKI